MLTFLSTLGLLAVAAPEPDQRPESTLARTLAQWRRSYEKGRLDLAHVVQDDERGKRVYAKGLLPLHRPVTLTHGRALEYLLDKAAAEPTLGVAREVLQLAVVGLGKSEVPFRRAPFQVRALALASLARMNDTGVVDLIARTASGDRAAWKRTWSTHLQTAALRALGQSKRSVLRPMIERQLRTDEPALRQAAVEALFDLRRAPSLPALVAAMARETDATVAQLLVVTSGAILQSHHRDVDAVTTRAVLGAAIGLLGRTDWRTDLSVVDLLQHFRTVAAIPALIAVLERFEDPTWLSQPSKVSGVLRHRAHEVLQELASTLIPADRPTEWRAFWEREKNRLELAPPREPTTDRARTVSTGFFGIPVQGSRVVFVIDTSRSMEARDVQSAQTGNAPTRLEVAARELRRAVAALPPDAQFNVIAFSDEVRPWRDDLVRATSTHKAALSDRLRAMRPNGGTNLFGALVKALGLAGGRRTASEIDEVFVLSDGDPSSGEVTDTELILRLVRESNRFARVRIHTVFMGAGADSLFMRRLAEENGGRHSGL